MCDIGFVIAGGDPNQGIEFMTCQDTGDWDKDLPVCERRLFIQIKGIYFRQLFLQLF